MKSLMLLWKRLASECASRCHTSATRDCKTVSCRAEHEGLSFLTITLPEFGKDLQKGLDQGQVDRNLFQGFKWKGGLPSLFSGFLDRVFDRTSGVLLDNPDVDAIQSVRQLTLMFSKIELPCTPEREQAAFNSYIQCEKEVRENDNLLSSERKLRFEKMSSLLFQSVYTDMDRDIYAGDVVPRHGPGATADYLRGNAKFRQKTWPRRLNEHFPLWDMLIPNARFSEHLDGVDLLEPGAETPVRVISVPKTLKTPRIIGIEPTAMQYAQQAVLPVILDGLSKKDYLASMLGFVDQTPNQRMARAGSISGDLATLDLSEASDRVSNQHVRMLYRNHPHLRDAVEACRSRKADVPGHGVKRLAKFASMGSALCFPTEAMVFLTIVMLGVQNALNTSLTLKDVKRLKGSVRIYGDDIIVPVEYVNTVVEELHAFGHVVNPSKSFWNGKFRESCGKDYYDGDDVSVIKCRRLFPTQRQHAQEVISIVSLRNQLYYAGYWQTVKWLDERIKEVIRHFPTVLPTSPVLGRHSVLGFETQRIGAHLHNPQVRGYVDTSRLPSSKLDGYGALLKFFLKQDGPPSADERHLERAGRPHVVDIKLRWCSAV